MKPEIYCVTEIQRRECFKEGGEVDNSKCYKKKKAKSQTFLFNFKNIENEN